MNINSFIKFVITICLINFIYINPIFSANYEFVQQKIKELREGDLSKKLKAVEILGALSSSANFAIPEMINILRNEKDFELRMQVIRALERIGGQANLTVPALIESLSEEDWQIRWSAAGALESFGKKAAMAVPELVMLLRDDEKFVRNAALSTLGKMGAISVLAMMKEVERPLSYSENQLEIKIMCIRSLGALGARAIISVPLLLKQTLDNNPMVRKAAITALRRVGRDANYPGQLGWLADPDELVWPTTSTENNSSLDIDFTEAKRQVMGVIIKAHLDAISDKNPEVRYAAVKGLSDFGVRSLPAKNKLIVFMNDENPLIRRVAIDVFASMGPDAVDVVPDLVSALGDFDMNVQWSAIQALRSIGKGSVPELIYILEYEEEIITANILRTFAELGPLASDARAAILLKLTHSNPEYRALAAEALGELGIRTDDVIQALNLLLNDPNKNVMQSANWSLKELEKIN